MGDPQVTMVFGLKCSKMDDLGVPEYFGKHPINISIHIMLRVNLVIGFPERTQSAGMNSGFVQFKTRAQAELARTKLNGKVGRGDLVAKSGEITRIMVISTCFLH